MDNDKPSNERTPTVVSDEQFPDDRGSDFTNTPRGEGSVGYRIAAMIAMLLLALAGILFWFFGRR
jgi:hypothetical protein